MTNTRTILLAIATLAAFVFATPIAAQALDLHPYPADWIQSDKITPEEAHEPGWKDKPNHHFARLGASIDTHDGRMIVSAYGVNSAYIFDWNGEEWEQTGTIASTHNILAGGIPGSDVGIYEDTAVVGAPRETSPGMNNHGAAYIWQETEPGHWKEILKIAEGEQANLESGQSVDIWEDTIVVSQSSGNGAILIYERDDAGAWHLEETFPGEHGAMGMAVLVIQDTIIASEARADQRTTSDGAVHIFERTDDGWAQTGTLVPPLPARTYGYSLDMDDEFLIVGAPWSDQFDGDYLYDGALLGKAFIYERTPQGWDLVADLDNPEPVPSTAFTTGPLFGADVALQGKTAVVGAPHAEPHRTGAAYVYERLGETSPDFDEGEWERTARLVYDEPYYGDNLGHAVEIEEGTILVGAPRDNNRQDGTPYPISNRGHIPVLGEDGSHAGSVYEFRSNPLHEALETAQE